MINEQQSHDLITHPCIPVINGHGVPDTLSLRETLIRAHEVKEINHSSPIVTASLVRMLVALLADIFPIAAGSQWKPIWERGRFDSAVIDAYFAKYHDRFDLFHPNYPFYQCSALEDDSPVHLNLLAAELSTGNNPTLFDHSLDTVERDYTPVEAFHLLLATQNFALAGLSKRTTRLKGEAAPLYWQNASNAAVVPGALIWLAGDNLFETLALNLPVVHNPDQDVPAWRQDHPEDLRDRVNGKVKVCVAPRGVRDRFTLQSRLVKLIPVRTHGGIVVRRAGFNHGRSLDGTQQNSFDPMLAYRPSKKEGYLVVRLQPGRAAWRDSHAMMNLDQRTKDGRFERIPPAAIKNLNDALARGVAGLDPTRLVRVNVAGLANDQAKVLLWRHDRLDSPAGVLTDPAAVEVIVNLLVDAEETASALRGATRRLCELVLAPLSVDPAGKHVEGALGADPDRSSALASAIDPRPAFWARLEGAFHRLLQHMVGDEDAAAEAWKDRVELEAARAFEEAAIQLGDSPRVLKAASLATRGFVVPSRRPHQPPVRKTKTAA